MGAGAAHGAAVLGQHHAHFGLGVGPGGDSVHLIKVQHGIIVGHQLADGVEQRIHRAVAARCRRHFLAVDRQGEDGALRAVGTAINLDLHHLDAVVPAQHFIVHQRDDILVKHLLLGVRQVLEALEGIAELVVRQVIAHFGQL